MRAHLAAIGYNGQGILRAHLAAIRCNGLNFTFNIAYVSFTYAPLLGVAAQRS